MDTKSADTARAEIMTVLDRRLEASRAKDIDRLMAVYSPGIVYFDIIPPHQFTGAGEVRRNFQRWFDEYEGDIGLETHDLHVAVSGDVAFAHMLHPTAAPVGTGRMPRSGCAPPCAWSGPAINGSSPTSTSRSPSIPRTGAPS